MNKTFKMLLSALSAMLFVVSAYAQVTTSNIAGRVVDAEGPAVGAVVTVVHTATGTQYFSVVDKNGQYRINNVLPGGPYTITVESLGYRTSEVNSFYTAIGETGVVDFQLEDESLSLDAVVVSADASDSGMNINRAGAGTTISERTKDMLPTTSRSLNDVMKLTPQASSTTNGLAIGGGNYRQSYVTVDGAAFNNAFGIGGNLPSGGAPISLDAIQQMSVNITPFDVRHSGFVGGAINAVTKSGSNDIHVSVYDYFTNDQFEGDRMGELSRAMSKTLNNTAGVSVGGPIIKNKLFFFINFEYQADQTAGSRIVARAKDSDSYGGTTARPTVAFMDEVKDFLADKFNYNPGRYQGYSLSTPDWKVMARIDWNINSNNKLNVRFSRTMNKYSSDPSSSVSPLDDIYSRKTYGRGSVYALCYESSRYYQEQNFTSVAAELNSRLSDNISNVARFTFSHQNEPRSFEGRLFPTVDVLGEEVEGKKTLLTSFGPDPFTYGNLRDVKTITATDEVSFNLGKHNVVAGAQYEWNTTANGYMQGGAGYYMYSSWDDFKKAAGGDTSIQPLQFAITHANRDDLQQVFPSFQYEQVSLYGQDEWNVSDNFKLTYGIRFELPIMPTIEGNENKEYLEIAAKSQSMKGTSTADMPKTTLNISPRVGFNWDVMGDRKLIVRGGSGIYTGRIPFVWIVSAAGNSNCLQAQYISKDGTKPNNGGPMPFKDNINDILSELYGGSFKAQDLAAPTGTTVMDKDFKMPATWKSSLAVDATLPGGIKASLEGIYNYDFTGVAVHKLGIVRGEDQQLPGEPEKRPTWKNEDGTLNSQGKSVQPYYITNSDLNGRYYSLTASLKKDFAFGLSLMAAYTRSGSWVLSDGLGDQVSSAYNTMTYGKDGSNVESLGRSTYVSPNRLIANVGYRFEEGKGATTIGLFYEGYNYCYIGDYSYTAYQYTMGNVTGDGGASNLIYIPTAAELQKMPFASDQNKAAYEAFIAGDKHLSAHRGEYAERGAIAAPWVNRFNLKIAQDMYVTSANGKQHTITIGLDVNNVGNLINPNWGCIKQLSKDEILSYKNNQYTFTAPTWQNYAKGVAGTWQMLLNLRYSF